MTPEDIVKRARKCLSDAASADRENREAGLDDLKWVAGRQWTDEEIQARAGRPTLTINLLAHHVRQVTGDIRRMNPAIKVLAADNDAAPEVAEVIEGLVRAIQQDSDAPSVYEGAAESAAMGSIGWFRVLTDYEDETSFNQKILIKRIHNALSVYCDPMARESTREDAQWMLVTDTMSGEDFDAAYPGKGRVDAERDGVTDGLEYWTQDGQVVIAEYFWREDEVSHLSLMPDGSTVEGKQKGAVRTREVRTPKVMWAKVSGLDVLEGPQEFPSRFIPLIAVTGEEINIGGEVARSSVIRYAKDPQKVYNYTASTSVELTALQPKAPYLVTTKQIAGLEEEWRRANDANVPFLRYKPDPDAQAPKREIPPQPSQAHIEALFRAREDVKAATGIHDAALGDRSNETSGVAIQRRQAESDTSTSIYSDNMAKAVAHCGRILVDMIPRIYDTPRTVRIVGSDDVEKMLEVNSQAFDPAQGVVDVNRITIGRYDVRVSVGPNYSTKRQEVAASMDSLIQAVPQVFPFIADLVVKARDWPDADVMAERLKAMVPPGVIKPDQMEPEEQQAAMQAQQQAAQQQQMQQAAMEAEIRKTMAEAAEKEAKAAVAGVEAQAALMQAGQGDAPQDPRQVVLELQQMAATIQETLARVGLIGAQTRKADADAMHATVQALTPPPEPKAPTKGASPAK